MARPKGDQAATAARRLAILDAALEVFGTSGFNGGTLKQVAEIVGITEAGILHHFKTKQGLLLEVLRHRDDWSSASIGDATGKPLTYVANWFHVMEYNQAHPGIVELYTVISAESTAENHPSHQFFQARYGMVRKMTTDNFEELMDAGHVSKKRNSKMLAEALLALSDGLQVQWLLDSTTDIVGHMEAFYQDVLTPEAWQQVCEIRRQNEGVLQAQIAAIGQPA
jgi:AcrR family transcriptional regulator